MYLDLLFCWKLYVLKLKKKCHCFNKMTFFTISFLFKSIVNTMHKKFSVQLSSLQDHSGFLQYPQSKSVREGFHLTLSARFSAFWSFFFIVFGFFYYRMMPS